MTNNGSNTISVLGQNANGSLATPLTYNVGSHPVGIAKADFTGAGRNALAVVNSLDNTITIYPGLTGPQLTATAQANGPATGVVKGTAASVHAFLLPL